MGSFSRILFALKRIGVSDHDVSDVTYAIELLNSAGDDFSDILFMWYDGQESKEKMLANAQDHITKLQGALHRIAISK